jgi:hypothetical protein
VTITKNDTVLLLLRAKPMDRIHLMKALFLFWNRSGRNIPGYFRFEPYLYGPCSFEVYSLLDDLCAQQLIVQLPHPVERWAEYYLTVRGRAAAEGAAKSADPQIRLQLEQVAEEVSRLALSELLRRVYEEAPEFSVNSVMRGIWGRWRSF